MEKLGLPTLTEKADKETDDRMQEEEEEEELFFQSPIMNEIMKRKKVFENYMSSPETTSNFKGTKSPKKNSVVNKNILISPPKKPGRPKGSKTRINLSPYMKTVEYDEEYAEEESESILEAASSIEPSYAYDQPAKQPKVQKKRNRPDGQKKQKITLMP